MWPDGAVYEIVRSTEEAAGEFLEMECVSRRTDGLRAHTSIAD